MNTSFSIGFRPLHLHLRGGLWLNPNGHSASTLRAELFVSDLEDENLHQDQRTSSTIATAVCAVNYMLTRMRLKVFNRRKLARIRSGGTDTSPPHWPHII